jgi:hypothetical protein
MSCASIGTISVCDRYDVELEDYDRAFIRSIGTISLCFRYDIEVEDSAIAHIPRSLSLAVNGLARQRFDHEGDYTLYRFLPPIDKSAMERRIQSSCIYDISIPQYTVVIFDHFFQADELTEINSALKKYSFSQNSTSMMGVHDPDVFTKTLSPLTNYFLFSSGLKVLDTAYQFLAHLAESCDAVVSTQPWIQGKRSAFHPNFVTHYTEKECGIHRDFQTNNFECFLPKVSGPGYYPPNFDNGAEGMPYLMTLLIYLTADNFDSNRHGMGTRIFEENGAVHVVDCINGRFLLGELNAKHDLQGAKFLKGAVNTYRISLNLLICFRHKDPQCLGSIKEKMDRLLKG